MTAMSEPTAAVHGLDEARAAAPAANRSGRAPLWFLAIAAVLVVVGVLVWQATRTRAATGADLRAATTACEGFVNDQLNETGTYSGERATGTTKHLAVTGLVQDAAGRFATYSCKIHPTDGGLLWQLDSLTLS